MMRGMHMDRTIRRLTCLMVLSHFAFAAPSATERQTAEWVLRQGGRVLVNGQRQPIDDLSKLPATSFRLTGVDLAGTIIDPQDLSRLAGLGSLTELALPGPIFTPFSDSPLDANQALKQLAALTNLQRLSFSLHFLPTYNVNDEGISYLATLTGLRELRLPQSLVKTPNFDAFAHLESLDLSDCPSFGDAGMAKLAGLKHLRRLYLRNDPVTDEGLRSLSGLPALEELDLYGTAVGDSGLGYLRNAVAIRKLNLLGANVSDAGVEILAGMPHLAELNLYRSQVSNSGLAKLAGLKELSSLDVRYSRVTGAGINSFKASHPNCDIEFSGGATAASGKVPAVLPAGQDDRSVAEWVKTGWWESGVQWRCPGGGFPSSTQVTDAQLAELEWIERTGTSGLGGNPGGRPGSARAG